jgi:hypothetical protein
MGTIIWAGEALQSYNELLKIYTIQSTIFCITQDAWTEDNKPQDISQPFYVQKGTQHNLSRQLQDMRRQGQAGMI